MPGELPSIEDASGQSPLPLCKRLCGQSVGPRFGQAVERSPDRCGNKWGNIRSSEAILGASREISQASWATSGTPQAVLVTSWSLVGFFFGLLGGLLSCLVHLLGHLGALLGPVLGPSCFGPLDLSWVPLLRNSLAE